MQMHIPPAAAKAIEILEANGYEGYLVGGCVRDACRGEMAHDWDMTTSAMPEETMAIFKAYPVIETGLKHGTVTVLLDGEPLEITTFRSDGDYADHRHPDAVTFVRDLESDLIRRDFTINAMAYSPRTGLVDPFGGQKDLEAGIIRAVGDPERRFDEDALRILRGLRFAARFGFEIEKNTRDAMSKLVHLLAFVSAERIYEELKKLLMGAYVKDIMLGCGEILHAVLPEIGPCIGFDQNNRYHIYDVWTHTAHAVAAAPAVLPVRMALLLHDIGKPNCYVIDEQGRGHFYGHAEVGAQMAEEVLRRLKSDRGTMEEVVWLISHHDMNIRPDARMARRLLSRFGPDRTCHLLMVMAADSLAHHPDHRQKAADAEALLALVEEVLAEKPCLTLRDLAVRGGDLMALGYEGPAIGAALNRLLEAVIEEQCSNEKTALLDFLKQ